MQQRLDALIEDMHVREAALQRRLDVLAQDVQDGRAREAALEQRMDSLKKDARDSVAVETVMGQRLDALTKDVQDGRAREAALEQRIEDGEEARRAQGVLISLALTRITNLEELLNRVGIRNG